MNTYQYNRQRAVQIAKGRQLLAKYDYEQQQRDRVRQLERENAALRSQIKKLLGEDAA